MAPPQDHQHHHYRKVLLLYLFALLFFTSVFITAYTEALPIEDEDIVPGMKKNISTTATTSSDGKIYSKKNTTKLLKPSTSSSSSSSSSKNTTKLMKATTVNGESTTKNKIKLINPTKDSVPSSKTIQFKKLNSTSSKVPSNSTINKSSDLTKTTTSAKNKTTTATKALTAKDTTKSQEEKKQSKNKDETQSTAEQKPKSQKSQKKPLPSWMDQDDDEDLVAEFRDLPSKFQETFLPDLNRISKSSQVYLSRYNTEITKGVKPLVGNKYAKTIASVVSFSFIIIPLVLVSLIFNRITAYFSLQKLLIFIQIYLSIYFSILCLSSLITGLEPLKFFYATSQSTYVCLQVLQTLGYVLYLLLLLMYLVLVFATETGPVTKSLGLGQTFVGFAVGLHYYMKVFHRAVLRQPPKTSWKVHALYATCFFVICLLTRADRRKKAYLEVGGEEGKKS